MPMFFVTFMELVFWIPNSLTIQIGWDRFGGGTRVCDLCAKRTFPSAFQLGWKRSATPLGAQTWRSMFRKLPKVRAGLAVNRLEPAPQN